MLGCTLLSCIAWSFVSSHGVQVRFHQSDYPTGTPTWPGNCRVGIALILGLAASHTKGVSEETFITLTINTSKSK